MKNLLLSFAAVILTGGFVKAQDKGQDAPEDLYGYYIGYDRNIIHFQTNNNCSITKMSQNTIVEEVSATWAINETGKLVFTDKEGKTLFELENQNGSWYERDKREFTFRMIYIPLKDADKPKRGEGC